MKCGLRRTATRQLTGVKVIMMKLAKHLPSQMNIAGQRTFPSFDGQPVTCYGSGDRGHINQVCPKRRAGGVVTTDSIPIHGLMLPLKAYKTNTAMTTLELR